MKVIPGKGEVTLEIKKGGLTADVIQAELQELFDKVIILGLNVIGTSDDIAVDTNNDGTIDGEDGDENEDGVLDTAIDTSTIIELKQEFQEAQQLYKQSKDLDKSAKVETIKTVSKKFNELMPKLDNFIEYSDQEAQLQTATRIKENIVKFQNALSGGNATGSEKSNDNLEILANNISTKAAQLLKNYQDAITNFDKGNKESETLYNRLRNISKIGDAKVA